MKQNTNQQVCLLNREMQFATTDWSQQKFASLKRDNKKVT